MVNLKKLELDMLEQVYKTIMDLPDNIVVSIPSLKSPLVLAEMKRIRQKIKNKVKMSETRLMNENSIPYTSSSSNNFCNSENKSRTSFSNEFDRSTDYQLKNRSLNSSKYGSSCDNNVVNGSNTNVLIHDLTDRVNSSPCLKPRERLSINELDFIVNNDNFDTYSNIVPTKLPFTDTNGNGCEGKKLFNTIQLIK